MKKHLLTALFVLGLMTTAHARTSSTVVTLKDASNVAFSSYSLTSGAAVETRAIRVKENQGFAALLVTEDIAGGAGDVDIYVEYSTDGTNWYRPYESDMAGTATIEGNVITAIQNVTRWIVFTPRMSPFMRIVFDPDANSEITAYLIYQKDR